MGTHDVVMKAWVLVVAMAVHSVMDGLSVGSEYQTHALTAFIIAVVSHKFFDGFVVGVTVYFAKLPLVHTAGALIFSAAMTPVGPVAVGTCTHTHSIPPPPWLSHFLCLVTLVMYGWGR